MILKWIGRIFAGLLFLFWGAFFIEHLFEWFMHPDQGLPPAWVWVGQILHFTMIIGLAIMIKWYLLGAIVTTIGTVAFFLSIGYKGFPFIAILNAIPIALMSMNWLINKRSRADIDITNPLEDSDDTKGLI